MKLIASALKKDLKDEGLCLSASVIFINLASCIETALSAGLFLPEISPELIFQVLERYKDQLEICENITKTVLHIMNFLGTECIENNLEKHLIYNLK